MLTCFWVEEQSQSNLCFHIIFHVIGTTVRYILGQNMSTTLGNGISAQKLIFEQGFKKTFTWRIYSSQVKFSLVRKNALKQKKILLMGSYHRKCNLSLVVDVNAPNIVIQSHQLCCTLCNAQYPHNTQYLLHNIHTMHSIHTMPALSA